MKKTILVLAAFLAAAAPAFAEAEIGKPAPAFTLKDLDGKPHSLSDYKNQYVVLEWTNYDCPFTKKHYSSGSMQALQAEYTAKGVVWFSVNSSAPGKQGYFDEATWKKRVDEAGAKPTAVLLDADGTVGKSYGARTTPHVFIVDPSGTLIYQGAIDDKPSADPADVAGAHNYVKAALDESLAGKPVTTPSTKSYGCSVKY